MSDSNYNTYRELYLEKSSRLGETFTISHKSTLPKLSNALSSELCCPKQSVFSNGFYGQDYYYFSSRRVFNGSEVSNSFILFVTLASLLATSNYHQ